VISPGRGRFRDYAAELFTIFAGILLALVADAAWDFGSERTTEREYLAGLRAELHASARELHADEAVRRLGLERMAATLEAAGGGPPLPDDSVPSAIVALLNYRFFSPARAVLDDLIDSGNLRILQSDSLRFELQRYLQQLDQLAVVEQRERDFISETLEPYVASKLRMDDLIPLQTYDNALDSPPDDTGDFNTMMRDDAFATLAFMRWERSRTAYAFGSGLNATIERLIGMLDRELGAD
jgi:hypothetical protein